jgi:hypothetical protein
MAINIPVLFEFSPVPAGKAGLPCSCWNLAIQVGGSLKYETVPRDPEKDTLSGPGSNCKLRIRPLVREGAPHQYTGNCQKVIKKRRGERKIVFGSEMGA